MIYVFSACFFIIGLVLVIISGAMPVWQGVDLGIVTSSAGSFICSAAIFSGFFEWRGKEAIAEYVWRQAVVAQELRNAGLQGFLADSGSVNVSDELKVAREVVYICAYSSRFLKRHETELAECLRKGGTVTVIVQDRASPTIEAMKSLNWDDEDINANYRSNSEISERLSQVGNFRLMVHKGLRSHSCLIIDNSVHITLATNANGRAKVPRLKTTRSGTFGTFVMEDYERMLKQSEDVSHA